MKKDLENVFQENFRQCCCETCGSITEVECGSQTEYSQLRERHKQLYELMKGRLGDDIKPLMEYDDLKNTLSGMENEAIYHRGFQDCIHLLRWLGML